MLGVEGNRRVLVILAIMTLHSLGEGGGVGGSFARKGGRERGLFIALAIGKKKKRKQKERKKDRKKKRRTTVRQAKGKNFSCARTTHHPPFSHRLHPLISLA